MADETLLFRSSDSLTVEFSNSVSTVISGISGHHADTVATLHGEGFEDFPGVVLRDGPRVLAVSGCTAEPDETVSCTLPVLMNTASWKDHDHLIRVLFQGIAAYGRLIGARGIHCLVDITDGVGEPSSGPSEDGKETAERKETPAGQFSSAHLMKFSGLECVTEIIRLEKDLVGEHENLKSPLPESLEALIASCNPENSGLLLEPQNDILPFLDRVLAESQDLLPIMRPSGRQLLSTWHHRRALTVILLDGSVPVAVAALSGVHGEVTSAEAETERSQRERSSANSNSLIRRMPVGSPRLAAMMRPDLNSEGPLLEYIGVDPQHRRKGYSLMLVRWLEQSLMQAVRSDRFADDKAAKNAISDGECSEKIVAIPSTLMAYADSKNEPAMSLYRAAGFRVAERYSLYYQVLQKTSSSGSLTDESGESP
ncbi:MAG: GNAT family N-acetyltransferase [Planctomyces sp.]